jgi:Uma2 family endonuclease
MPSEYGLLLVVAPAAACATGHPGQMPDWITSRGEVRRVSIALVEHTGPWTPDDVEALPDLGDHARFEVYEGGVLVVSPAPGVAHQRTSYWLHRCLARAASAAGADVDVLEAVNVILPGGKLLVPDIVIVAVEAADRAATRLSHEAVLAVVEIVSPSTQAMDRAIKPGLYAAAGIPTYWRVELDPPSIVVCSLSQGRYVTRTTLTAGNPGRITRPFILELDPAQMIRRTT